jgi:hypothetical protein
LISTRRQRIDAQPRIGAAAVLPGIAVDAQAAVAGTQVGAVRHGRVGAARQTAQLRLAFQRHQRRLPLRLGQLQRERVQRQFVDAVVPALTAAGGGRPADAGAGRRHQNRPPVGVEFDLQQQAVDIDAAGGQAARRAVEVGALQRQCRRADGRCVGSLQAGASKHRVDRAGRYRGRRGGDVQLQPASQVIGTGAQRQPEVFVAQRQLLGRRVRQFDPPRWRVWRRWGGAGQTAPVEPPGGVAEDVQLAGLQPHAIKVQATRARKASPAGDRQAFDGEQRRAALDRRQFERACLHLHRFEHQGLSQRGAEIDAVVGAGVEAPAGDACRRGG